LQEVIDWYEPSGKLEYVAIVTFSHQSIFVSALQGYCCLPVS
jgi:hypothetical protein